MALDRKPSPNDLNAFWMPFTSNRQFKKAPRMFVGARDMHYTTDDGRQVLDGTAGLWCCNAGHCRPKITEAIQRQAAEMDYAPAFQMGHPQAFELANRIIDIAPDGIEHVFYTNSGSEAVETALKLAIAYHRARGDGARTRLIGRERGYHGVNFGGIRTPVDPAIGSTITAAMVSAPCSATMRSSSSARLAPCSGWPREKVFCAGRCVWGMWSTPARSVPNILRLFTIPPTEMPPKFTP